MVGATQRARHQVEARVLRSDAAVPKGAQLPVDLSRVLAFIARGDVLPKKRRCNRQARKRTDFVWRGEDCRHNRRIPLRSSLSGALRFEKPGLPRNLSAFSRSYAKSTDCLAEKGGFEPPILFQDGRNSSRVWRTIRPEKSIPAEEKLCARDSALRISPVPLGATLMRRIW